jgi:hypothetical protein
VPGPAFTFDPCSSGTDRTKAAAGVIPSQMNGSFVVYIPGMCTAQGIGPDATFFTDRLRLVFEAYEEAAVERVLVGGDGLGALGPYLGDSNMELLGSGAEKALRSLQLLEEEIAKVGGGGIIHAGPQTATAWDSKGVTENVRGTKRTMLGTPIAVGTGYIDAIPDGKSAAGPTRSGRSRRGRSRCCVRPTRRWCRRATRRRSTGR